MNVYLYSFRVFYPPTMVRNAHVPLQYILYHESDDAIDHAYASTISNLQ